MKESSILREIMVAVSKIGARVLRNNVGVLRDDRGNYIRYGLCIGSSDLIGWKSTTITTEMVGQRLAQFVAIEVKRPKGFLTLEQADFLRAVRESGGIAAVAHNAEEAIKALS